MTINNEKHNGIFVIPKEELEVLLTQAAKQGANMALSQLGIENHTAHDLHELRDLLEAWREARRTAWQTVIKVATTGILAAIILGVAIKFKQP